MKRTRRRARTKTKRARVRGPYRKRRTLTRRNRTRNRRRRGSTRKRRRTRRIVKQRLRGGMQASASAGQVVKRDMSASCPRDNFEILFSGYSDLTDGGVGILKLYCIARVYAREQRVQDLSAGIKALVSESKSGPGNKDEIISLRKRLNDISDKYTVAMMNYTEGQACSTDGCTRLPVIGETCCLRCEDNPGEHDEDCLNISETDMKYGYEYIRDLLENRDNVVIGEIMNTFVKRYLTLRKDQISENATAIAAMALKLEPEPFPISLDMAAAGAPAGVISPGGYVGSDFSFDSSSPGSDLSDLFRSPS